MWHRGPSQRAGPLANRLAQHYESVRGHDLEQRRYMFKVEY